MRHLHPTFECPAACWILLVGSMVLGFATPLAAQTPDKDADLRFVAGLRQRRLFSMANDFCRDRLNDRELDSAQRVPLVLELMKTQAAQATVTTGTQRAQFWNEADKTGTNFLAQNPSHPRRMLIEVQRTLNVLSQGRIMRQEIDAEILAEDQTPIALNLLRKANLDFGGIERKIEAIIPEQRAKSLAPGELSVDQWVALRNNVRFQRALTNLNRAQLFPADDNLNRIDALHEVLRSLDENLRTVDSADPLWWNVQIARASCKRLLGQLADAGTILADLEEVKEDTDESTRQDILEQQLLIAISLKDKNLNQKLLLRAGKISSRKPTLDLAVLQLLMAQPELESGTDDKNKWLAMAEQQTRQIASAHGPYWGRRADLTLISSGPASPEQPNTTSPPKSTDPNSNEATQIGILTRRAQQSVRNGNLSDAIKGYDRAVAIASESENAEQALPLAIEAAKLVEQQKQHLDAAKRFLSSATASPNSPLAAATHLRGCWNLAQATKTTGASAEVRQQFIQSLESHLSQWPTATSANQARIWLAAQQQASGDWQSAFTSYQQVSSESKFFLSAIRQGAYCVERLMQTNRPTQQVADDFVTQLETYLTQSTNVSAANPIDLEAVVALSRIGLSHTDFPAANILKLLKKSAVGMPPEAESKLAVWMIAAIVCSDSNSDDINLWMEKLPATSSDSSEPSLESLALALKKTAVRRRNQRDAINRLRLQVADQQLADPSLAKRIFWVSERANSLSEMGRYAEAVQSLQVLAKAKPNSAAAQLELARTLAKVPGQENLALALKQWRLIASRSKANTETWFEAKYHVALLLEKSGERSKALKLLQYLKAVPPGWENSRWKSKFQALLTKCQSN